MRKHLDHYLNLLAAYDPLTEEQHAAIETRVRREVIARYGRFGIPRMATDRVRMATGFTDRELVPSGAIPRFGTLSFLRPAFAFAGVAAVAVGAVLALQARGFGLFRPARVSVPAIAPPAEVVAVATSIGPGSGVAVSVFSVPAAVPPLGVRNPSQPPLIQRGGGRRSSAYRRPINPAPGVFDQWGESVFSEEERLQSGREGKNVFNS